MHESYKVLKGIKLPGDTGIVTGRVYNWLANLNYKIKPASCVVEDLGNDALMLGKVFVKLGKYLMESAGVNIAVDEYDALHQELKNRYPIVSTSCVQIIDSSQGFDWLQYPDYTVLSVADSLFLKNERDEHVLIGQGGQAISIFASWEIAYTAVLLGERVILDFKNVRLPDQESSGRESFMEVCKRILDFALQPSLKLLLKVFSDICSTIKRGGFRRHGAMTTSLQTTSTHIQEYLSIPFAYLSHIKKGVLIRKETVHNDIGLIKQCIDAQNKGEVFFEKSLKYSKGKELRSNVCRAIQLIPGDQCLISVVNFGMCRTYIDIVTAYTEITQFLVDVHNLQVELGHPLLDKQIAVSVTGLANMLRNFGTSYPEFIDMLALYNFANDNQFDIHEQYKDDVNYLLISHIDKGVSISSQLAKRAGMRACLTIEPGESCSRRYKDIRGYDICPNIDPPNIVAGIGIERRHSETGVYDTKGNLIHPEFNYGVDIFPASQLTEEQHFTLWNEFNYLQNRYGMSHGACYEMWYEWTWTSFIKWWYSPLPFVYYNRRVGTKHLEKGTELNARERMQAQRLKKQELETCDINNREACSSCGD